MRVITPEHFFKAGFSELYPPIVRYPSKAKKVCRDELKEAIRGLPENISVAASLSAKTPYDVFDLLANTIGFTIDVSETFGRKFQMLVDHYSKEFGRSRVLEYVQSRGLDRPCSSIFDHTFSTKALSELGFSNKVNIKADELLVNFVMPKPLQQWWAKGGEQFSFDPAIQKIDREILQWGWFYRQQIRLLWGLRDGDAAFAKKLTFGRLNNENMHSPDFYYLWVVGNNPQFSSYDRAVMRDVISYTDWRDSDSDLLDRKVSTGNFL